MADGDISREHLAALISNPSSYDELESLLVSRSNLPGPRGNLELASAFADCFAGVSPTGAQWELLLRWASIPSSEAPTNDPREFLPFCALQALSSSFLSTDAGRRQRIIEILKAAAGDARWRLREGVAMGFQRIAERDFGVVRKIITSWAEHASYLGQRAIVATLAHPPVLDDPDSAAFCLSISDGIVSQVASAGPGARKGEDFRVLRQGLEYALSVFVAALPGEGFAFLERWAANPDPDIKRIVRSNLGKSRLKKKHPDQVERLLALL